MHKHRLGCRLIHAALLLLFAVSTGCSSLNRQVSNLVFPPHWYSNERKGEKVDLMLYFHKTDVEKPKLPPPPPGKAAVAAAPLVPLVAGAVAKAVESFLQSEAELYRATYSATIASDIFYRSPQPGSDINLRSVLLQRRIAGHETPAMELCYGVVPTHDNAAFELTLSDVVLRASKAKVVAWDWLSPFGLDLLNPWSIVTEGPSGIPRDGDVDLTVLASLQALWFDGENIHVEEVARQQVSRKAVELRGFSASPDFAKNCADTVNAEQRHVFANLYPSVPRSELAEGVYGTGNFILTVLVTEDDEFGERVKELAAKLDEHKQGLVDSLTGALQ